MKHIKLSHQATQHSTQITNLSSELYGIIFSHLKLTEIMPLLLCSRKSFELVSSNYFFWLNKYNENIKEDFIYNRNPKTFISRLKQKFLNQRFIRDNVNEIRNDVYTSQSDITQLHYDIETNDVIVSSDDQTIKIVKDNNVIGRLLGHRGGVWTFDVSGNYLVSGSTDKTLRVWCLKSRRCLHVMKGHTSTVRCLKVTTDDYVISGGRDSDIRVWKLNGEFLHVLKSHKESVRCMDVSNNLLVTGSYDGLVILWDFKKGKKIKQLKTHMSRVYCVKISEKYIVSSGQCANIYVSDLCGDFKYVLNAHKSVVPLLEINGDYLLSAGADAACIRWDLNNGNILYTRKASSFITVVKSFNELLVIGTNTDVNLYDLKTGKFIRNLIKNKYLIFDASFVHNNIVIGFKDEIGTGITKLSYKTI